MNSNHRRLRFSHGGIDGCLIFDLGSGDLLRFPLPMRIFPFSVEEFVIDSHLGGGLFGGCGCILDALLELEELICLSAFSSSLKTKSAAACLKAAR